jgi:hypothetical protein
MPMLTDSQVLDFCRTGMLLLPGAVPEVINAKARAYLEGSVPVGEPAIKCRYSPARAQ